MIIALGFIAAQQAKGTEKMYANTLWILNYGATHINATIRYTARNIILRIHSDASYLSKYLACSRAGGNYFLGRTRPDISNPPTTRPRLNGPIHSIYRLMSNLMGSANEANIGAAYINGQEAFPIRTLLRSQMARDRKSHL